MVIDLKSDILFKDTLDYVDKIFGEVGITYSDMGFMFSGAYDNIDNIAEKYPELAKYIKTHDKYDNGAMSSARTEENGNYALRVPKSEHKFLRELVKKTPRPYSFGAISIFLDNVHWFDTPFEINTTPCLVGNTLQKSTFPNAYFPQSYMSNCVTLVKGYNYGKKFNPVWFTIEVGNEQTGIIDSSVLEEKLVAAFGKPFGTRYYQASYRFYFNDEEKKRLIELDKSFSTIYKPFMKEVTDSVNNAEGIQHIKELRFPERASTLSPAKAFKKALPKKQYECKGTPDGTFRIIKKNENNHTFMLFCSLSPSWRKFFSSIVISGYNFEYETDINNIDKNGFEVLYPYNQEEMEYHCGNLVKALIKTEDQLSDELLNVYGKSLI